MKKEYKVVDNWHLQNRKGIRWRLAKWLIRKDLNVFLEKLLWDIDRYVDANVGKHNKTVKKGSLIQGDFVLALLEHFREDIKNMVKFRFKGGI